MTDVVMVPHVDCSVNDDTDVDMVPHVDCCSVNDD